MKTLEKDGLFYEITENETERFAFITGCNSLSEKIIIPSHIDDVPVKSIDWGAFKDVDSVKEIVIEEGIEKIEYGAFQKCTSLQSVHLPKSLKIIRSHAFEGCVELKNVVVQEGLEIIGDCAFRNCSMTEFNFPESLQTIGERAFNSVPLQNISFGKNLIRICDSAFRNCHSLSSVSFSEGLQETGDFVFENCINLQELSFPNSLGLLGYGIIDGCNELHSVYIGKNTSISHVEEDFGYNCLSLKKITVAPGNEHLKTIDGVLYDLDTKTLLKVPCSLESFRISIPSWVEELAFASFEDIQNVKNVKFNRDSILGLEDSHISTIKNLLISCPINSEIYNFAKDAKLDVGSRKSQLSSFLDENTENEKDK